MLNPSELKTTKKVKKNTMLFAEDAAVAAYSPSQPQYLIDRFARVCTVFELITKNVPRLKSRHCQGAHFEHIF